MNRPDKCTWCSAKALLPEIGQQRYACGSLAVDRGEFLGWFHSLQCIKLQADQIAKDAKDLRELLHKQGRI
jgi:hypothetical protein